MPAASATAEIFRCPGEEYDISRSVHLARVAAFYSKCRVCPHAPAGHRSPDATDVLYGLDMPAAGQSRHVRSAFFTPEGVRGRYLNELTRSLAAEIAGAMASRCWDDAGPVPSAGRPPALPVADATTDVELWEPEGIRILDPEHPGPAVVVAHDERPSSPDIVTGVAQALRRMGCQVIDIGLATRPCWMFAINHLRAAAGVQVTGAGCDPGMIGLDFVGKGGIPCSAPGELSRIAERFNAGYSRPSRRPGSQRTFQASIPYEAGLWKHFHALRPLTIALACPSQAVLAAFHRIFRKLACRLAPVDTPTRLRTARDSNDPDLIRVSRSIGEMRADLGVLIEDDGEQCTFLDECGRIVAPRQVAPLLSEIARADAQAQSVVISPAAWGSGQAERADCRFGERAPQSTRYITDTSRENMTRAMQGQPALFGADGTGRYWFAESYPACDAILTVVHLLQALSQSDATLSHVVQNARL